MSEKKVFKVGQYWERVDGNIEVIKEIIIGGEYPIITKRNLSYDMNGKNNYGPSIDLDLVKQVDIINDLGESELDKFAAKFKLRTEGGYNICFFELVVDQVFGCVIVESGATYDKIPMKWDLDGKVCGLYREDFNLVPREQTVSYWYNIYPSCTSPSYPSKELADYGADDNRIACIQSTITYKRGEGL